MSDERVSALIAEFQRRLPAFEQMRRRAPQEIKQDFFTRFFTEQILFGDKMNYDGILQGLLTDEEHARLDMDREFTQAWRVFVDLCWIKKQAKRGVWVFGGILLLFVLIISALLSLPYVAGPSQ